MTEDQIRDLLREMRDDPIPPDSLARVRLGIADRIQARPRIFTPWRIAAAFLAIGCLILVALLPRTEPIAKPAGPVVAYQVDTLPEVPAPAPVAPRARRPVRHAIEQVRRVEKPPEMGGAAVIRIETPDPEIVILLVGE